MTGYKTMSVLLYCSQYKNVFKGLWLSSKVLSMHALYKGRRHTLEVF